MPRCRECKEKFEPKYFNQKYCMNKDECIKAFSEYVKEVNKKKERKEAREKKKELMTHSNWIQVLQPVFNTYIRLRDKDLPCISCGRYDVEEFHAGHYVAANYQYHRFTETNVHKQCSYCNTHLRGNLIDYRKGLIEKIGLEEVEYLEQSKRMMLEITIPEIQEKIKYYKEKIKELK